MQKCYDRKEKGLFKIDNDQNSEMILVHCVNSDFLALVNKKRNLLLFKTEISAIK